jgi:hypothetical protein
MDESEYIGECQALGVEADEAGFSGQVDDGGGYGGVFQQLLFQGVDAGCTVQSPDTEGYLSGSFAGMGRLFRTQWRSSLYGDV